MTREEEIKLREEIAEQVADKMDYMYTCANERETILNIILDKSKPFDSHCNIDCNNDECKVHPLHHLFLKNKTNGEVIRDLFNNESIHIDEFIHDVNIRENLNVVGHFQREWWDKKYKGDYNAE